MHYIYRCAPCNNNFVRWFSRVATLAYVQCHLQRLWLYDLFLFCIHSVCVRAVPFHSEPIFKSMTKCATWINLHSITRYHYSKKNFVCLTIFYGKQLTKNCFDGKDDGRNNQRERKIQISIIRKYNLSFRRMRTRTRETCKRHQKQPRKKNTSFGVLVFCLPAIKPPPHHKNPSSDGRNTTLFICISISIYILFAHSFHVYSCFFFARFVYGSNMIS